MSEREEAGDASGITRRRRRVPFPAFSPRLEKWVAGTMTNEPSQKPGDGSLQADASNKADGAKTESVRSPSTQHPDPAETEPVTPGRTGATDNPGRDLGDYELVEEIARGGMGVVFKAHQKRLNRTVALKMILSGDFAGEEEIRRFHVEAEAAANLQHPAIVPIYEVGEYQGRHFFSMGYVEGTTAASLVENGPIDSRQAADLMRQIVDAIVYAHDQKVVHRDLKPGNILLDSEGKPKVTDFGLAKRIDSDAGLTGTDQILGTPAYMSPEQAAGKPGEVGVRSDIYSLGGILYFFLTGRPPFQAANVIDILTQVIHSEPISPRRLNGSVDLDLETICLKCLQKAPGDRYATASELCDELDRYLNDEPIHARPTGSATRVIRWCRRNRPLAAAIGCVVVLLLGMGIAGPLIALKQARLAKSEIGLRQAAEEERSKALEAEADASRAREYAEQNADRALQLYYGVGTSLSQVTRREGNLTRFRTLLNRHRPVEVGEKDIRSFEWYYLRKLAEAGNDAPESQRLPGHTRAITDVAFSPNGQVLATASLDGNVILWDMTGDPEPIGKLGDGKSPVVALAFGPCGRRLAVAQQLSDQPPGQNAVVLMYDVLTGADQQAPLFVWGGFASGVHVMAFSPDGSVLVTGDGSAPVEGLIYYWDVATGRQRRLIYPNINEIHAIQFSPDGRLLAIGGGWDSMRGELRLLDALSGEVVRIMEGVTQQVNGVCFSPDGKWLASAEGVPQEPGFVRLWNVDSGDPVWTNNEHDAGVTSVRYTPDGERIVSGSFDKTARVWDLEGRQQLLALQHDAPVTSLAFSCDSTALITAGGSDAQPELRFWDASPVEESVQGRGHLESIVQVSFWEGRGNGNGAVVSLSKDESLRTWDIDTGLQTDVIQNVVGWPTGFAIDPQHHRLLAAGSPAARGEIRTWDLDTRKMLKSKQLQAGNVVTHLTSSTDGKRVAIAQSEALKSVNEPVPKKVLLVNPTTLECETVFETVDLITGIEISEDGSLLALATGAPMTRMNEPKNELRMVELTKQQSLWTVTGLPRPIYSLSFSHDGEQLVYSDYTAVEAAQGETAATVIVLDAVSGDEKARIDVQGYQAQFVGPGSILAISVNDKQLRLWDLEKQREVDRIENVHTVSCPVAWDATGNRFAWAVDGRFVEGAERDHTVHFGGRPSGHSRTAMNPWPRVGPRTAKDSVASIQEATRNRLAELPGPSAEDIAQRHAFAKTYRQQEEQLVAISEAFRSYVRKHRGSMPADITDDDGKPLLSWRVALLPELGEQELYDEFHLGESWESPHNQKLLSKIPECYRTDETDTHTCWQRLVGKGAFWSPEIAGDRRKARDDSDHTLSIVEAAPGVPWTQPVDLDFEQPQDLADRLARGRTGKGFHAMRASLSTNFLQVNVPTNLLLAMITAAGGEKIDHDALAGHEGWSPNQTRWVEYGPTRMRGKLLIPDPALPKIPATKNTLAVKLRTAPQPPLPPQIEEAFIGAIMARRKIMFGNGIKNAVLSLSSYETVYRRLATNIVDKEGNPLLSWRVAILPFMDESELFEKFHRDEPWDSPHNLRLLREIPAAYSIPAADEFEYGALLISPPRGIEEVNRNSDGLTYIQGIVNPGAAFAPVDPSKPSFRRLSQYSNKIVLVESAEAVPWTKPIDLDLGDLNDDSLLDRIGSGEFENTIHAAFGNGSVRSMQKDELTKERIREWVIEPTP